MEFLVRLSDKNDNPAGSKKGDFITFKPDGWSWGTNERKHYGIVRIKCTEAEAQKMCESETALMLGEKVITKYRKTKFDIDALPKATLSTWNDQKTYSPIIMAEKI